MDIHKNARLSFRSRESLCEICSGTGGDAEGGRGRLPRQCQDRSQMGWAVIVQFGTAGLGDRSSRPHFCPRQTSSSLVEKVVVLRRGHMPGYEIARRTGLSPASVSRILRRARLSRWRDLNPPPPVQRYEHPRPGDLLHLDIKGMTRFSEVSRRGDGRLRGKRKHPGFLALHVAVDDHSRMAFTQMLPDQKAETTIGFLHSAVRLLRHATASACAPCSPTTAAATAPASSVMACQQMQLKHRRTRPYTPQNQWKGGAIYPDRLARVGLRQTLDRIGATRRYTCNPGPTTTTTKDPMVASTTSRPSAAPKSVQPLDHLQAPSFV